METATKHRVRWWLSFTELASTPGDTPLSSSISPPRDWRSARSTSADMDNPRAVADTSMNGSSTPMMWLHFWSTFGLATLAFQFSFTVTASAR
jgi:hypothetical protein